MLSDDRLQGVNRHLFDLTTENFTFGISNADLFQLLVVLQKEFHQLERHIDFWVASKLSVLFESRSTAGKCVLVDLGFNLLGCIGKENCGVLVASRHLGLSSLQCWEKCRVHQGWFWESESRSDVSSHSKIGILVDSTRNQALHFLCPENIWKSGGEGWGSLSSRETNLPDWVRIAEAEDSFDLIESHALLNSNDVLVKCRPLAHVVQV